ncbi:hypothetical protein D9619_011542 [Psilocybe cf. subviscida]|uniref:F-box domain-containing protein n=1 Tax=Psilocybe cf. subviscida TaxID=2480587 RepID=A0A8H5BSX7_9AGAR|nr:hypothetical protein D9619_011542 [Psilocybe cf. subviscida]
MAADLFHGDLGRGMDYTLGLPPETLTEIFQWIYTISLGSSVYPPMNGKVVRDLCWPTSQVCRYWREVALASPILWAHLPCLNLIYRDEGALDEQSEALKVLIARARSHPLHVSVVFPTIWTYITDMDLESMVQAIDNLTRHSKRWQSLSINAAPDIVECLFQSTRGRLPRLEALTLDFLDGEEADVTIFMDTPKLKFVHITGSTPEGLLLLDTRALVRLQDDMAAIMRAVPPDHGFSLLTALELRDGDMSWDSIDQENYVFPVLKTLDYHHDRDDLPVGFMRFAITPALEELSIKTITVEDIIGELVEMCLRSGTIPLKKLCLRIRIVGCDIDGFANLLRLLPTLEILDMNIPRIKQIIELYVSQGSDVLVPRLRKCSFLFEGDDLVDELFDSALGLTLTRLASARCGPSPNESEGQHAVGMQLLLQTDRPGRTRRCRPGTGFDEEEYHYLAFQPTRLEPWFKPQYQFPPWPAQSDMPHNAYTQAGALIPTVLDRWSQPVDLDSFEYRRTLNLLEDVERNYKGTQVVQFLNANTNICMIALAYMLKKCLPADAQGNNPPYERVVRLMKRVKEDLMERLDDFHWIWETTPDADTIRYIPDQHEMREDRDKFANAVLGLSDDQWLLDDF